MLLYRKKRRLYGGRKGGRKEAYCSSLSFFHRKLVASLGSKREKERWLAKVDGRRRGGEKRDTRLF